MTALATAWWLVMAWPGTSAPPYAPNVMPEPSYAKCEAVGQRLAPVFRPVQWTCLPPIPHLATNDGE